MTDGIVTTVQIEVTPVPHIVPMYQTPEQLCALFGFMCTGEHAQTDLDLHYENNPIAFALTEGRFPSKQTIRERIKRPFLHLEGYGEKECTLRETEKYWFIDHRVNERTPVSIVKVTRFGPTNNRYCYHYGTVVADDRKGESAVVFNHLGHTIPLGSIWFVHCFELILKVPPGFKY